MAAHRKVIGDAAGQFVSRLLPDDQVRIGGFSNEIVLAPTAFTSDQARLRDVLQSEITRIGGGASPVWAAMSRSLDALDGSALRRVIVLLSDGHDAPASQIPGQARPRAYHFGDVLERVRAAGVAVYTMGFLTRQMGRAAYDGVRVYPPSPLLEQLSRVSGGSYAEVGSETDFAARFSAIADELHNQYLLGLSVEVRDGKRHRIEVRVRREGVKVRARQSYVAQPAP